ncbi:MAG: SMC family ATPase [Pseudanabaenaceae cyanobacterium bins.68]|nr:SMC family ATPase [Pseudanabaenaceae cyanobacterium bins.68]
MRLISLRLENFRQHKSLEILFPAGLTGILGLNGCGKSTILEAIAWAIYGNQAKIMRAGSESLIWRYAPGKSSAVAELEFSLNQQVYRVKRSQTSKKHSAELAQAGKVIANSASAVNQLLIQIVGMSDQEFFNSYFTAQGDLNFLGAINGAAERERFIAKMLGYEKITEIQGSTSQPGSIRADRAELQAQVNRLEGGLAEQAEILTKLAQAGIEQADRSSQLRLAEQTYTQLGDRLDLLLPNLEISQQKFHQYQRIKQAQEISQIQLDQLQRQIQQLTTERSQTITKIAEIEQISAQVQDYLDLQPQLEQLETLHSQAIAQTQYQNQLQQYQTDLDQITHQIAVLAEVPAQLSQTEAAIAGLQTQIANQQAQIQQLNYAWQQSQQQLEKLQQQYQTICTAGSAGICPTCERPLEAEYDHVLQHFRAQICHLEQLSPPTHPHTLPENQAQLAIAQQQLKQLIAAKTEWQLLTVSATKLQDQIDQLRQKINPVAFDPAQYQQLKARIAQLQPLYHQYLRAADLPSQLQKINRQIDQLQQQIDCQPDYHTALAQLNFAPDQHQQLLGAIAELETQIAQAQQVTAQARQDYALADQALAQTQAQADQLALKAEQLHQVKIEVLMLTEIDQAFGQLRQYLIEQIRPQLAENASFFLSQLTDGRYNALEIDQKYNVILIDQGDRQPVISGGEQDIVNLCLRLAISQMIAERSGQAFSLLILDEVFGSLDQYRQENLIHLLHRLENQFEQVLLITHIESIKEGLTHAIQLEFDLEQGHTRVVS